MQLEITEGLFWKIENARQSGEQPVVALERLLSDDWSAGSRRVLDFLKKHGVIHDFIVQENRVGIQVKDEPNFVFLNK